MVRAARCIPLAVIVFGLFPGWVAAQELGPWHSELAPAVQVAAQSNRLVLVHIWAPWCGPCQRMEREVFTQPGLYEALAGNYVLVKLNADEHQEEVARFGVRMLPSDVILSPDGRVMKVLQSPQTADLYAGLVNQIAVAARASQAAQVAAATPPTVAPGAIPQAAVVAPPYGQQVTPTTPATTSGVPDRYAPAIQPSAAATQLNPAVTPTASDPAQQPQGQQPRLLMDGFCPVQLVENRVWAQGDARLSGVYQGQLFYFSSPEAQQWFWSNPERYTPVHLGNDIVIHLDQRQLVPGRREHGVYYGGRVYLFASEQSLSVFYANPDRYAVPPATSPPAAPPQQPAVPR